MYNIKSTPVSEPGEKHNHGDDYVQYAVPTPHLFQYLVIDTTMEMALTQEFTDRMQVWQELYTNNKVTLFCPALNCTSEFALCSVYCKVSVH